MLYGSDIDQGDEKLFFQKFIYIFNFEYRVMKRDAGIAQNFWQVRIKYNISGIGPVTCL